MKNVLRSITERRQNGENIGVYSACSAHPLVLEAVIKKAKATGGLAVIESTANQVNQYGGYTGTVPAAFAALVRAIADRYALPQEQLILGGDHLGPLVWTNESNEDAMQKAEELIRQYVKAGYTKIHIDTSMLLRDDSLGGIPDAKRIADRGARLCKIAEETYLELRKATPGAVQPVYIIGSEVPIPGGIKENEGLHVTSLADFESTVEDFREAFYRYGIQHAWENVIAVVVQTGVEFGDKIIFEYDRSKMKDLIPALKKYPQLCFEGHSTDYQTRANLKSMVEDGIAILKVGPALTFALREALFSLEEIEKCLIADPTARSYFREIIELEMLKDKKHWLNHYHGTEPEISLARKYSYSDRIRYYLNLDAVKQSFYKLEKNIDGTEIPLTLFSQFMHNQYTKLRAGELKPSFRELAIDRITEYIDDYIYAIGGK